MSLDQGGKLTLPGGVVQLIDTFEFDGRLAARWFPLGKDVPIVIDPEFGGGRPTIPHRRLMVETIHQRWLAGQKIAFIADDFALEPPLVEDVLRYAERYAA